METAAAQAGLLFRIVEELDVPCGYERSFKMLPGRLLANRFLLGINTADLTETARDVIYEGFFAGVVFSFL